MKAGSRASSTSARWGWPTGGADLAIGSWSPAWNYGPGHEPAHFQGYGIAPEEDRIAYYRLLWDLGE